MSREHPLAIVARRLAAYLPPGAVETECTLPVATLDDWFREAGAPSLPPEARAGAAAGGVRADEPLALGRRRRGRPSAPASRGPESHPIWPRNLR